MIYEFFYECRYERRLVHVSNHKLAYLFVEDSLFIFFTFFNV